jgi:hypothetical protein
VDDKAGDYSRARKSENAAGVCPKSASSKGEGRGEGYMSSCTEQNSDKLE